MDVSIEVSVDVAEDVVAAYTAAFVEFKVLVKTVEYVPKEEVKRLDCVLNCPYPNVDIELYCVTEEM